MKVLYIGGQVLTPQNGGDMIEYRNQRLLEQITEGQVKYLNPDSIEPRSISARIGMGVSTSFLKDIQFELKQDNYSVVFISQSYFGRCSKFIKNNIKNKPVCNFFHNAEADFFLERYKKNKSLRSYLYYKKAQFWERIATRYADIIITLNERDSQRLKSIYGRQSDLILPTTFSDSYKFVEVDSSKKNIDYLFLGSSFFANDEGVQFFLDEVFPKIPGRLCVAGKNMDKVQFKNLNDRVTVLGFVDDLNEIYARSRFVISPIFSGSGMKTKTAEALMYGKTIIGTKEAFEGYKVDENCMIECNTSQEFINTLRDLYHSESHDVNEAARKHYMNNYSDECVLPVLRNMLYKICQ